jgi:hypothetical protein
MILLFVAIPISSQANFSGMVYIESPTAPVESMIEDILSDSNIYARLATQTKDLKNLKKALLKGCTNDRDVFLGLMKIRNKILPEMKGLPIEERQKVYDTNINYIKTAALEFGYKDLGN